MNETVKRQLGALEAAEQSNLNEATADRERCEVAFEIGCTYEIEDDIDAATVGLFCNRAHEIVGFICDRYVRSKLANLIEFGVVGSCINSRPGHMRQLNSG